MELTDDDLIFLLILGGVIFFIWKVIITHRDEKGRIVDQSVTIANVRDSLMTFNPVVNPDLKGGYTEKYIQSQLKKHLLKSFVHVTDEYGIEGINASKIDFDIGNGKVGLEIKLAKEVFKTSNFNRLTGQIENYTKYKYKDENLIVLIVGENEHANERSYLKLIKEKIEEKGATYAFLEIKI